jgi:hypothetical protein
MKKTVFASAAIVALTSGSAALADWSATVEYNLAGLTVNDVFLYETGFTTFVDFNIGFQGNGDAFQVVSAEFVDVAASTIGGSWGLELALLAGNHTSLAFAETWSNRVFPGGTAPGSYGPASAAFVTTPPANIGGGPFAVTSGILRLAAWNTFTDPGFNVTSGVFRVTYVPAPGAIALLGVAGLVGSRRRRA